MEMKVETAKVISAETSPSGMKVLWREFLKDRLALGSLILLIIILVGVYTASFFIDTVALSRINFLQMYKPPSSEHWLGTDKGGREVLQQLIIGTRNSITISFCVTAITAVVGLTAGLIAGYFGGLTDSIIMRVIDFIITLPTLMFIIVFVTIVPKYSVFTFILIMSAFLWTGKARLIRSKVLSERELDYVHASQTLGTPHWKIIINHILPNISSIIIVNFTLNLAGNIGLESGLTYLGFGLPESTPSLGTLISYARNADILENKWWIWLPASAMILLLMMSINFIGQALKRAADAKQRRG